MPGLATRPQCTHCLFGAGNRLAVDLDDDVLGAQASLGSLYERGVGLPQDYAQAALWFRKAAD